MVPDEDNEMKGLGAGKGWVKPFGVAYLSWLAPFHPFFRPDFGFKGLTGQPCVLQKRFLQPLL